VYVVNVLREDLELVIEFIRQCEEFGWTAVSLEQESVHGLRCTGQRIVACRGFSTLNRAVYGDMAVLDTILRPDGVHASCEVKARPMGSLRDSLNELACELSRQARYVEAFATRCHDGSLQGPECVLSVGHAGDHERSSE
jgi:hypothetical protein